MAKFPFFVASLAAFSCAFCDSTGETLIEISKEIAPLSALEVAETPQEMTPTPAANLLPVVKTTKAALKEIALSPFTGKVKGKRVRLRTRADLESPIVKELNKSDLLKIVGEMGDFYAVEAPEGIKAYVFRSYVLEGIVEANKVNLRIGPDLESPVIGHLSHGDKVEGVVSAVNNKWYEVAPPSNVHFYIAKDYVERLGGPEIKAQLDKRRHSVNHIIESAHQLTASELRKDFREADMDRVAQAYNVIIKDYADFPEQVEQARESLVAAQEAYLQKKISSYDGRSAGSLDEEKADAALNLPRESSLTIAQITDKMKIWEPLEEAVYLSWSRVNEGKDIQTYYEEQKMAATPVSGILEPYSDPVRNKPGDFILKENDIPVAYVYSTKVNLQDYVGKRITVMGAERPKNNFAFPAYFVFSIE